jgi:hypothetical protein
MGQVYNELGKAAIKNAPDYFATRLVVEECENIHVHYRNLRLEFSIDEFYVFADAITKASRSLEKRVSLVKLSLEKIDPYNATHPRGFENTDKQHREGIELVKGLIKQGKKILPILVKSMPDGTYLRQDGFKRFFAFKELGYKEIDCYVSPIAKFGGQDGMPWEVKNA